LMPLFKLFDRDDDGSISMEEFLRCHKMLNNALEVASCSQASLSILLSGTAEDIFKLVDLNTNGRIEFGEFMRWQSEAMFNCGLGKEELVEVVQKASNLVQAVFSLWSDARREQLMLERDPVLDRMLKQIAMSSMELWRVPPPSTRTLPESSCLWFSMPEEGMRTEDLVAVHMEETPLNTESTSFLCVDPCIVQQKATGEDQQNRWLAKLFRTLHLFTHERREEACFYTWADGAWKADQQLCDDFTEARAALPAEIRILCILLTEGNFGDVLTWAQIKSAMTKAVSEYILTAEDSLKYIMHKQQQIFVQSRSRMSMAETPLSPRRFEEHLLEKVRYSPLEVMYQLMQMGFVATHPLWASR